MSKLTPHQAEVLMRLVRRCRAPRLSVLETTAEIATAVSAKAIGSEVALIHLREKGYIVIDHNETGPRGGITVFVRPTQLGLEHVQRRIRREIALNKETS